MALGDVLTGNQGGLVKNVSFTPEMAAQGIELIPSGTTADLTLPQGPQSPTRRGVAMPEIFPDVGGGMQGVQNMMLMEGTAGAQRAQGPQLRPEDFRPKNPYNPNESIVPEDDAMTPPGQLAPSEVKETGGFFTKLGDILANPANQKLLATLGMQISPHNTALGEFAIAGAEAEAQRRFGEALEGGARDDASIPGLSVEGRESVLGRRSAQQEQESLQARRESVTQREIEAGERAAKRLDEVDIPQEERLQSLAKLEEKALQVASNLQERDPEKMARIGSRILGVKIPEDMDLSIFTPNEVNTFLKELAQTRRTQIATRARGKTKTDPASLSEEIKEAQLRTLGTRLNRLQKELISATGRRASSLRTEILNQMQETENQVLELGGDPSKLLSAPAPAGQDSTAAPGSDLTPLREQVKEIFPGVSDRALREASREDLEIMLELNR